MFVFATASLPGFADLVGLHDDGDKPPPPPPPGCPRRFRLGLFASMLVVAVGLSSWGGVLSYHQMTALDSAARTATAVPTLTNFNATFERFVADAYAFCCDFNHGGPETRCPSIKDLWVSAGPMVCYDLPTSPTADGFVRSLLSMLADEERECMIAAAVSCGTGALTGIVLGLAMCCCCRKRVKHRRGSKRRGSRAGRRRRGTGASASPHMAGSPPLLMDGGAAPENQSYGAVYSVGRHYDSDASVVSSARSVASVDPLAGQGARLPV